MDTPYTCFECKNRASKEASNERQGRYWHKYLPYEAPASMGAGEALKRLKWMDYYHKHVNARLTCRYFGISPTTFYKWRNRFQAHGLSGLEDRSSCPRRKRVSTVPREHVSLIVAIRREYPAWSKHKIAVILRRDHGIAVSASTVGRILSRKGLYNEKKSLKRRRSARKRAAKLRADKWMKDLYPGSLVQIDTKHLRFAGQRYYQFTAVDCFTRVGFIHVSSGISSTAGREFLSRLAEFMPFDLQAVQTDNGSEYEKEFEKALTSDGIEHYFTYPKCPQQNGRVERAILTTEEELWAYREGYSVKELNEIADEWNHTYNNVRPHQSLGYKTPGEYLKSWSEMSEDREHMSTM